MACYNRREKTLAALRALGDALTSAKYTVYLVDDGSTDGTAEVVLDQFPETVVIHGDGGLFWAASMCLAERNAMQESFDYLLWLNDDTELIPGVINGMLDVSEQYADSIIVGATVDPESGKMTYGGRRRVDSHPQRFSLASIRADMQSVDNFNGNCVLIPMSVRTLLGPIDGGFPHGFADDDYGQRAMSCGIEMLQVPGFVGFCRSNESPRIPTGVVNRWRYYESPKALPWRAQYRYMRRHGDFKWPLWFAGSVFKRMAGW